MFDHVGRSFSFACAKRTLRATFIAESARRGIEAFSWGLAYAMHVELSGFSSRDTRMTQSTVKQMPASAITRWIVTAVAILVATGTASRAAPAATCSQAGPLVGLSMLPEASGVTVSRRTPRLLWSINDSGQPLLFALDTSGASKNTLRVTGAVVDDWEDITAGPCGSGSCLYIADVGDNRRSRQEIKIYRTIEPQLQDRATEPVEVFTARYPDGPHDAEAVFITTDARLFLITKENSAAALYRFPNPLRSGITMTLERMGTLGSSKGGVDTRVARITDADASPDGAWVALRTNEQLFIYRTNALTAGTGGPVSTLSLRSLHEPQGEGVTLDGDGTVYLVGEGGGRGTFASLRCQLTP
jgi:hypothetical protein